MTTFTVPLSNSRLETDIRRGLCGIRKLNPRNPRLKLFSKQPFIQPLVDIDIDHSTSCTDCSPRQYIRRIMHSLVHTGNSHGTSPQGRRSYHIPFRILHTERGGKGKSRCRMVFSRFRRNITEQFSSAGTFTIYSSHPFTKYRYLIISHCVNAFIRACILFYNLPYGYLAGCDCANFQSNGKKEKKI